MEKLIFDVTIDEDGRYVAQARGTGIATDGGSWEELKCEVQDLITCYYDGADKPSGVQLVLAEEFGGRLRTPRDFSSARLVRHLEREWGYTVVRQKGSHILLTAEVPSHHIVPVPQQSAIGLGLLRSIVGQVADAKGCKG